VTSTSRLAFALVVVWTVGMIAIASRLVQIGLEAQQPQPPGSPVVTVPGSVTPPSPDVPSQTALVVKEVDSPAEPPHYGAQAIWALVMAYVIQYLKKSPWFGWLTPQSSARLKTQFGFFMAAATAAGIHFAVSGSVFDGGGASITVTGLSVTAFKDVAWQWASQQAWYRLVVKEPREVTLVSSLETIDPGKDKI